eukprot:TRINITY_DN16608_c0_g1_i3.p2 TRINITY_DN16608_c0_g1~~TRINITY_DN16608_c0_g1_i3.p2  ORF type:complete len:167 (-),score=26.77 TRINITY_DN16608_c0_g1_i3:54-554(-)
MEKKCIESIEYTSELGQTMYTNECSFCLDTFQPKEKLAIFFCKHVYHLDCVQAWNTAETRPLKCPMCQQAFPLKGEEVDLQNSSHFGNDSLEEAQQEDKKDKDVRNLEFNFQNEELNDVQKLEENLIQKDLNLNSNKKLKANYNQKQQQQDQIEYGGSYYQFKNQL